MVCMGLEPAATGCQVQTIPPNYCVCHTFSLFLCQKYFLSHTGGILLFTIQHSPDSKEIPRKTLLTLVEVPRVNLCKELNASYQRRVTLVKRCQIVEQKECNTCNEMSIRTKEAIHLHRQFVIAYLDTETGTAIYRVKLCCGNFLVTHGQWWWSSGQHSRLLL